MNPVEVIENDGPLLLAMPHSGLYVTPDMEQKLNDRGRLLSDTDWHIDRLYEGLIDEATIVRANFHRYMIDANRDPSGQSLYPGQNTTALCPLTDFEGQAIYLSAQEPAEEDIQWRLGHFHRAYHKALEDQLQRIRNLHGYAVLYDCHSIRSRIPYLFEGQLPDFNIGTFDGKSCAGLIENAVAQACASATGYSSVLNGRFKGGWTTRHYGKPQTGVHALQMELAQRTYMQEHHPWNWQQDSAERLRFHLRRILQKITALASSGALLEE